MHGQKKRRKRTISGAADVPAGRFEWQLMSEPQWSNSGDGYKGMCVCVRTPDVSHRELIIEYPFPVDKRGRKLPVPVRPPLNQVMIETSITQAIEAGWLPESRGKPFIFYAPDPYR